MKKIKMLYDVARTMRTMAKIDGAAAITVSKDQGDVFSLQNRFAKDETGRVKAHVTSKMNLNGEDLTKPFSPAEFMARIKSHLKRYERLKGSADHREMILCRGLEINTASHQVFVNEREIQLTAKEYEILSFMASHPNIVFSKERLMDAVWGDEYYGDTATIAVHIQKIRKKIEADPTAPAYIETLWGTGCRFNP